MAYIARKYVNVFTDKNYMDDCWKWPPPDSIKVFEFGQDEFDRLYDSGILWDFNRHFDLMLDEFESGIINTDLVYVLDESKKIKDTCPTVYAAIAEAARLGFGLEFAL